MAGQGAEVVGGDAGVLGTDHAVDESDGEVEACRVLQEMGESLGSGVLAAVGFARRIDPGTDEFDASFGKWEIAHGTLKASG